MNAFLRFLKIIILFIITLSTYAQDYQVRIGFIGNSITIGSGLANPVRDCYPSQLAVMLKEIYGDTCIITNYAVSGRTLLKNGDFPIWNEPDFKRMWDYSPDICFISLGTNDSKPYNWDVYGQEFYRDYKALTDTFLSRNPAVKFIVCYPPPAFAVVWGIRNPVIINDIIPLVDSIVKTTGAELVDFYNPLLDSVSLFPDKIHPNPRGAKAMATIALETIVSSAIIHKIETSHTFVTSLKSNIIGELRLNDPVTLSWTTRNATEAFLNGELVSLNGSLIVTPSDTTKYVLVAKGELNNDSMIFIQNTYIPILEKFSAIVSRKSINQGDTSKIKLNCFDQNGKIISDSVFKVNWTVEKGFGRFVNEGANLIQFVGDSIGTANIVCSIRGISTKIAIKINKLVTSSGFNTIENELTVFPNPFNKSIIFYIPGRKSGDLKIEIIDANGRVCISESKQMKVSEKESIELNTDCLSKGIYFYQLVLSGNHYSGMLVKE